MSTPVRMFTMAGLLAAVLVPSAPAWGDVFGPIALVSQSPAQQVDYAHDPAVSADGRYVAFDGSFGGVTGVWRRDLRTGEIAAVAGTDAELPSISANGQFISFTTTARLSPLDQNKGPDVYVRNIASPPGEEGAFELASAVTVEGSTKGLAYGYASEPTDNRRTFEEEHYGSLAGGRSALSADGRTVVFVTSAASDLTDPQTPAEPITPPLQVVVRNLDTAETRLISTQLGSSDEPVSTQEGTEVYGAVFTGQPGKAPAFSEPPAYGRYAAGPPLAASISADGSTVAWMGVNVQQQATLLPAEARSPAYTEPLWRRIAPGSETPTERVTGGSDPLDPACIASGESSIGNSPPPSDPCQGPFSTPEGSLPSGIWAGGGDGNFVPRLSADGYTVAFIARAQLASLGEGFGIGPDGPSDLYVVNMRNGHTRMDALRQLTRLASGNETDVATTAAILDFGISPDGSQLAFSTRRTRFVLGSPSYVTAAAAQAGMGELFQVDLADDTLTRVTSGYEGGGGEHPHPTQAPGTDPYTEGDGALSPSFSADGRELVFASTASNLAFGDGNTPSAPGSNFDGSDAFVVQRAVFGENVAPQIVSPAPAGPALTPAWRLSATARSLRNGEVQLQVRAPGPGLLRARARSAVRVRANRTARRARNGRAAAAAAVRPSERAKSGVATRTVASRSARARGGLLTLTLELAKPFRALARVRGGLSSTVQLSFASPGHPSLRTSVEVTFARAKKRAHRASAGARSDRGGVAQ